MAQFDHTQLEAKPFVMLTEISRERLGIILRSFRNDHDRMRLAAFIGVAQIQRHGFGICLDFGQYDTLRSTSDAGHQSEVAAISPHDFHQKRSFVRRGGDFDAVDGFQGDIQCCVHANRDFRTAQVVVNRRGNADNGETLLRECKRASW
jgi:hypothetical protein